MNFKTLFSDQKLNKKKLQRAFSDRKLNKMNLALTLMNILYSISYFTLQKSTKTKKKLLTLT